MSSTRCPCLQMCLYLLSGTHCDLLIISWNDLEGLYVRTHMPESGAPDILSISSCQPQGTGSRRNKPVWIRQEIIQTIHLRQVDDVSSTWQMQCAVKTCDLCSRISTWRPSSWLKPDSQSRHVHCAQEEILDVLKSLSEILLLWTQTQSDQSPAASGAEWEN